MPAPITNLEEQKRRHKGPLAGMWLAVAVAALLFVIWLVWVFAISDPDEAGTEVPGTATAIETTQPATTETQTGTPDAQETTPAVE